MINTVITDIYSKLQDIPFIPTSTATTSSTMLCTPREMYTVHHLDFNPSEYIPESLLYAATGRRYALQELGEYELNPELTGPDALNIPVLDVSAVITVLQYLGSTTSGVQAAASGSKRAEHIHSIAGALLLLDILVRHQQHSTATRTSTNTRTLPKLNNTSSSMKAVSYTHLTLPTICSV